MDNNNINFQNIPDDFNSQQDFYTKFKERLEDVETFPTDYIFKFIYPSSEETMKQIKDIFEEINPKYEYKASKSRKYTSISVMIHAKDADQVIKYYQEVATIKDVIML